MESRATCTSSSAFATSSVAAMPSAPKETCNECRFDAAEWNATDTLRTLDNAANLVGFWAEGMADDALGNRPDAETWSVDEYTDHLRETFFGMRMLTGVTVETPGTELGAEPAPAEPGPARELDSGAVRAGFAAEAGELVAALRAVPSEQWDNPAALAPATFDGVPHSVGWAARHAVHDLWHHLHDIAAIRISLGDGPIPQQGTVAQISRSDGGVPKTAVHTARVHRRGIEGDVQKARQHHGRPWQALCLYSAEVIAALQAEGHPISAGSSGENLTLSGLDWSLLRAGAILTIGEMRCELSAPAVPCSKNNQWFADGDSNRIDHGRHPGWSRWYASVLDSGQITAGDGAQLIG